MFDNLKSRIFRAFGNWVIQRAMRTPYFHLFHDDGRPYMERYWLLRFGMPKGWRHTERLIADQERMLANNGHLSEEARESVRGAIGQMRASIYPRFGIRIHHIQSSDDTVFHDHPWNYTTLILRGSYIEVTPDWTHGATPSHVTISDDYDGHEPTTYGLEHYQTFEAGALLRRKAATWHYLLLPKGGEAWTIFITGRKRQSWGFLVDGLVKVPWRLYLQKRAERAATSNKQ